MSACLKVREEALDTEYPPKLVVYERDDPQRGEIESFIQSIYLARYGAHVRVFTPVLVGLKDEHGQLVAAVGYRCADANPLFLEQYFDAPIEQVMSRNAGLGLSRLGLVEVAHLVALKPGQGRRMMSELGALLQSKGVIWIVSTVTRELRHLFARMGIAPLALGAADAGCLGDDVKDWGSYYAHEPVVLAVQLQIAMRLNPRLVGGA
jgi:hypothetical protein